MLVVIRQHDAKTLAAGYSPAFRAVEILSITTFFVAVGALLWRLAPSMVAAPWLAVLMVVLGYLSADFISGFVHWMADTWGSTEVPVVGQALIRPFREHHVDAEAITRHDFIETNGANCLISLPVTAVAFWTHDTVALFLTSMVVWVMATNQFHKWSHTRQRGAAVRFLQRLHLILPVDHHGLHHGAPFTRNYCITAGWMNYPLERIGFFRTLERLVTAATGMVPREDDIGKDAALATLGPSGDEPEAKTSPVSG
jgi:plasmanylethanolamine desaturase